MSLYKDETLKEAVLNLSQKEKDKLLLRLINKDKMLLKQLHYELLEDESDLEDRISDLKAKLDALFEEAANHIKNIPQYSNYKQLQAAMRHASGLINEHEKVTKDKFSVAECRLIVLEEAFSRFPKLFEPAAISTAWKLHKYVQGRIKNANTAYSKLHEDLQFDLQAQMDEVLHFVAEKPVLLV